MKQIYLIRHGKTNGNLEKKYIGRTDEALCEEGILELAEKKDEYPDVSLVFTSTMKRCTQTADLIYEGKEKIQMPMLRECDFGIFEKKNYEQLKDNPYYQAWIDSSGTSDIPGGEGAEQFKKRSSEAFQQILDIMEERMADSAAVIAHGGTFMAILEAYAPEPKGFYGWQMKNGDVRKLVLKRRKIVAIE